MPREGKQKSPLAFHLFGGYNQVIHCWSLIDYFQLFLSHPKSPATGGPQFAGMTGGGGRESQGALHNCIRSLQKQSLGPSHRAQAGEYPSRCIVVECSARLLPQEWTIPGPDEPAPRQSCFAKITLPGVIFTGPTIPAIPGSLQGGKQALPLGFNYT